VVARRVKQSWGVKPRAWGAWNTHQRGARSRQVVSSALLPVYHEASRVLPADRYHMRVERKRGGESGRSRCEG